MARRKPPKPPTPTDAHPDLPGSKPISQVLGLALKGKTMAGLAVGTLLSILFKLLPLILQAASWWVNLSPANAEQFRALGADPSQFDPRLQKAIAVWEKQEAKAEPATKASESTESEYDLGHGGGRQGGW
jgi:hypothetical protein